MAAGGRQRLFLDFLIITVEDRDGEPQPQVHWRLNKASSDINESEIVQFAFPYPELLKKQTSKSLAPADEFVFVLSKAGSSDADVAVSRTFGFCRRVIGPGVSGRHDLGLRFPECLCILATQPLFSLFPAVLKEAQGLRLVNPEALPNFIKGVCFPNPFPMRGETIRVSIPHPRISPPMKDADLRYTMPSSEDSPLWGDVGAAALLHALGARRFLLVLTALLSERRIIMVCKNLRKLTVCVCSAIASLQPFVWQHIFIPLLPSKLLSYACAPYPFLIGLHASHLPEILDPESGLALSEVIVVDLDQGELHIAGSEGGCGRQDADEAPVMRDILGGGVLSPPRAVRRGADRLDGLRVKATKFLASRLEMITPVDIASSVETYSERTADAASALSERLHSIVSSHTGRTSSWRLAMSTDDQGEKPNDIAEAPPAWTAPGSPGSIFATSSAASSSSASSSSPSSSTSYGVGPDDTALSEALLVFYLQLVGDPKPFTTHEEGTPVVEIPGGSAGLRRDSALSIDAVRRRFLSNRKRERERYLGGGDSPALTSFLEEFVHTQQFQCFSLARDSKGRAKTVDASTPFFFCAATIAQFGQPFDRKSIRKAVARLQITGSTDGAGSSLMASFLSSPQQRHHPVALQLTSNTPFAGDAKSAMTTLCRSIGSGNSFVAELGRVVRTIEWRLFDASGLKWRHGHKALLLLHTLVIFGPEAALAEALDLLPVLKSLESYKSGLPPGAGSGSGEYVRSAARSLSALVVDTARLRRERARCLGGLMLHHRPVGKTPPFEQLAPSAGMASFPPFTALHAVHKPPPKALHATKKTHPKPGSTTNTSNGVLNTPLVAASKQGLLDFDSFVLPSPSKKDGASSDLFASFSETSGSWDPSWDVDPPTSFTEDSSTFGTNSLPFFDSADHVEQRIGSISLAAASTAAAAPVTAPPAAAVLPVASPPLAAKVVPLPSSPENNRAAATLSRSMSVEIQKADWDGHWFDDISDSTAAADPFGAVSSALLAPAAGLSPTNTWNNNLVDLSSLRDDSIATSTKLPVQQQHSATSTKIPATVSSPKLDPGSYQLGVARNTVGAMMFEDTGFQNPSWPAPIAALRDEKAAAVDPFSTLVLDMGIGKEGT
mmetsp:Transcript_6753/g.12510  ORF Transcript_6753/g.12510 Transcript_6753/m.12510 type:complete len:1122 (-) Transcript_6753:179-3544(-)|eukprot:CAMPEP_0171963030 /NCGR_PEP_ID=MMETSP0993-20121228/172929_1 /TAXON_ID=483369 /ORGANISM="non described non described, Strain CCMP2098" /LENGTH=1121 /DNA_ID=CAMNT_0012611501 /DNA_START=8 /DNA_END=3373 /DNA_ORIENTATION=+